MAAGAFLGGKWPVLLTESSGLVGHNLALEERHDYAAAARRTSEPLL